MKNAVIFKIIVFDLTAKAASSYKSRFSQFASFSKLFQSKKKKSFFSKAFINTEN